MNFLDEFISTNDEVKQRVVSEFDFGQPLNNEANDVPIYDQFNTGLALTENDRPNVNLQLDPMADSARCGITGTIPSMETGLALGATPQPRQLILDTSQLLPEEELRAMANQRRLRSGINI